ncbi:MAG TPA: hypothetical protein VNH11_19340 [Pirellulales bacterium]|nr:hypothetical protein [Pirellulales bacterium]
MIRRKPSASAKARRRKATNDAKGADAIADTIALLDQLEPHSPKAKRIVAMLRSWLADESGYDEETWPMLKKALDRERSRVGARKLFDG